MDPPNVEAMEKELEELREENAILTESVNNLEVCVGQLIKEVRFLKQEVVKNHAGNRLAS